MRVDTQLVNETSPRQSDMGGQTADRWGTVTYEAKLSASLLGICKHQCIQPNIQSDKQPATVSQPLPHDTTIPEWTTGPVVCVLNRQSCGTGDLGAQWRGYPGISSLSVEVFVIAVALFSDEDNTCCKRAHWPVAALCVLVTGKMKLINTQAEEQVWSKWLE